VRRMEMTFVANTGRKGTAQRAHMGVFVQQFAHAVALPASLKRRFERFGSAGGQHKAGHKQPDPDQCPPPFSDLTIFSTIFLASASNIIVLSA